MPIFKRNLYKKEAIQTAKRKLVVFSALLRSLNIQSNTFILFDAILFKKDWYEFSKGFCQLVLNLSTLTKTLDHNSLL